MNYDGLELKFLFADRLTIRTKNKRSPARVCVTNEYQLSMFRGYVVVALFKLYQYNVK